MSQAPSQPPNADGTQPTNKPSGCMVQVAEGLYYDKCRSFYSPPAGYGRVVLSVENDREYVLELRSDGDSTFVFVNVDGVPMARPLGKLKQLLKPIKNLAPYHAVIEGIIQGLVMSSERLARYVPTVASKEIPLGSDRLYIGLKADGSIILRFNNNTARADGEGGLARALAQLLPPNLLTQYGQLITSEVRKFIDEVSARGYVKVGDTIVSTGEDEVYMLYNTAIVGDKMVMMIPLNAQVVGQGASRDSIPVLVIISDSNGNTQLAMTVASPRSPAEVYIDNKTLVRDFLSQFSSAKDIRPYLPSGRLINYIRKYLEQPLPINELINRIGAYLDRYVELREREREIAKLLGVAQVFYDTIYVFPLIAIIGEKGSGKKQFANTMASMMPIYVRTGHVTPAILYRLTTALAPALALDETERTLAENPELLNMGYEADVFVQRAKPTSEGHKIESFVVYGPKYLVGKPLTFYVREDVESRIIYFLMIKSKKFYPPVDPNSDERYNVVGTLVAFKARYWRVFRDTYQMLKQELILFDQRYVDDYLPLLTIAYMLGDKCVFYNVLRDMIRTYNSTREETGWLAVVTYGVLGKLVDYKDTFRGGVETIDITPKEIVEYAAKYLPLRSEEGVIDEEVYKAVGRFLSRIHRFSEGFVVNKRKGHNNMVYTIDIEALYDYVRRYDVDLSLLPASDRKVLEELTGLDWSVASSVDRWVMCVMNRLFFNGLPVDKCMEGGNVDFSAVESVVNACRVWGVSPGQEGRGQQTGSTSATATGQEASLAQPVSSSQVENSVSASVPQTELASQQVVNSTPMPQGQPANASTAGPPQPGVTGSSVPELQRPRRNCMHDCKYCSMELDCFFGEEPRSTPPTARELWCSSTCIEWYRADNERVNECVSKCLSCPGVFDPPTMGCNQG